MDTGATHRPLGEQGVSSVQFLLASALALLMFLAFANLVVIQYGRGAIQSALDQAARAGSVTRSVDVCEAVAEDVLGQLLGGSMGDAVDLACTVNGGVVVASATAVFDGWTPIVPDFAVALESAAVIEQA